MKKTYRNSSVLGKALALTLMGSLAFVSCQNNDNDIYDEDPIIRLDKAKMEMRNHLINESENGWIINFRPDGGIQTGEFTAWFDFQDQGNKVLIKTDFDRNDLKPESSEYNFVMLRTFALSFPTGNKIHQFTQGHIINDEGKKELYSNRSDIEFMFNEYLANGDVETIGYLSGQKVVFRKATKEDVAFNLQDKWEQYDRLETMSKVTLVQDGVIKRLNFEAIKQMRAAYIGKITERTNADGTKSKSISDVLTDTGAVTFGVNADNEIELVPALELENGKTIDKLIWIGNGFYGSADDQNSILIQR